MPSWTVHLVIANKICNKVNMKENEFVFANIMPDILEGYKVKSISKKIDNYSTHYPILTNINGINIPIPNIEKFKNEYEDKLDNPIILGYFSHLITDYFWNIYTYKNYFKNFDNEKHLIKVRLNNSNTKILEFDEAVKIKQRDFKKFSNLLSKDLKLLHLSYDNSILEYSKTIREFSFTQDDIKNTINYINKSIKSNQNIIEEECEIFTKQELLEKIDECVGFILEYIRRK